MARYPLRTARLVDGSEGAIEGAIEGVIIDTRPFLLVFGDVTERARRRCETFQRRQQVGRGCDEVAISLAEQWMSAFRATCQLRAIHAIARPAQEPLPPSGRVLQREEPRYRPRRHEDALPPPHIC